MPILDRLADRALSLLGLDFELSLDWESSSPDRVADGLYVGSCPVEADVTALHALGITHVVSCLQESERASVDFLASEFDSRFFRMRDSVYQEISPCFSEFSALAEEVRARRGRLLVHCRAGVSRSATLAIAEVMRSECVGFYDAYTAVRAGRQAVLPNVGFASQLQRFEHSLPVPSQTGASSLARYLVTVCRVPVEVAVLDAALAEHEFDGMRAILSISGGDMPRVVQGVRN